MTSSEEKIMIDLVGQVCDQLEAINNSLERIIEIMTVRG